MNTVDKFNILMSAKKTSSIIRITKEKKTKEAFEIRESTRSKIDNCI